MQLELGSPSPSLDSLLSTGAMASPCIWLMTRLATHLCRDPLDIGEHVHCTIAHILVVYRSNHDMIHVIDNKDIYFTIDLIKYYKHF